MRHDNDAVSPWSFFLPVLLAVVVGSLIADGVQRVFLREAMPEASPVAGRDQAVDAGVALEPALQAQDVSPMPPAPTPVAMPPTAPEALPVPDLDPDAADLVQPDAPAAPPADPASAESTSAGTDAGVDADGNPRLPGPISARRSGASRSCINNTVADRSPNGWAQALENDAPVRCSATSQ